MHLVTSESVFVSYVSKEGSFGKTGQGLQRLFEHALGVLIESSHERQRALLTPGLHGIVLLIASL